MDVVVLGILDGIVLTGMGVPICLRTKVIHLHHGTGVKLRWPLLIHPDRTTTIEAGSSSSHPPEDPETALSDEQREEILRPRRCQGLLNTPDSHMSTVTASGAPTAIGPTLEQDVVVGGVAAIAMVDTGSRSSIISRSLLHKIGRHLGRLSKPVPTLEPASVRLYGKDGTAGQHELKLLLRLL